LATIFSLFLTLTFKEFLSNDSITYMFLCKHQSYVIASQCPNKINAHLGYLINFRNLNLNSKYTAEYSTINNEHRIKKNRKLDKYR